VREKIKPVVQPKTDLKDVLETHADDAASQTPEMSLKWIQNTELMEVPAKARRLLEEYGKVPSSDIMTHINEVVSASCMKKTKSC
jgi:hypothetical protein